MRKGMRESAAEKVADLIFGPSVQGGTADDHGLITSALSSPSMQNAQACDLGVPLQAGLGGEDSNPQ